MTFSFGATSTTDEVLRGINLSGKRVLVTGVSAGLGVETARALAAHGAQVVGAARDLSKAQAATEQVREQAAGGGSLELVQVDLASLDSVRRCADGLLAASKPFDLIQHTRYEEFIAYGRFKTANVLFAVEFDRRHKTRGVRATAVHPGGIRTELSRHLTPDVLQKLIADINASQPQGAAPFTYKSIPQGAATSVWAACVADADTIGGRYCEDCHVAEVVTAPGLRAGVRPYALDQQRARGLWHKSEEMVNQRFN